jgi:formamidopyrimidine-DNA glycosylase
MPELPEVEAAVRLLRATTEGRTIVSARLMHPSLRVRLGPRRLRSLAGARVGRVERRGKHQLLHLEDGRALHAHFRMAGDWLVGRATDPQPRFARAVLELDDGARVWLVDPRALSTLDLRDAAGTIDLGLGPEAIDPALRPDDLARAVARRRGAVKPALLDQRLIAGIGNIYAVEALWRARIDPRAPAASLSRSDVARLLSAIRVVMRRALERPTRFAVYDREGLPCRRCGAAVSRIVQAGRSTYFCPGCQLAPRGPTATLSRALRAARP